MSLEDLFGSAAQGAQSTISNSVDRQVHGIVSRGVHAVTGKYNNSIQSGLSRFVSKGSQQILSALGIPASSLPELSNISGAIVSAGVDAANKIFQGILSGDVTQKSVNSLSSLDVTKAAALNNNATASQMLSLGSLVNVSQLQGTGSIASVYGASVSGSTTGANGQAEKIKPVKAYADDLFLHAPKYKFLYVVEFKFNGGMSGKEFKNDFAFLIKQFDRPNISIQHDDVNMYGYRTKIPKSTTYEPITIQIHDDIHNKSMNFFASYLRAVSPIANVQGSTDPLSYQQISMQYDLTGHHGTLATNNYAGSFGTLQTPQGTSSTEDSMTILSSINLYHVYDYGKFMNIYEFKNPKVMQMSLDALSMEDAGLSSITLQLAYDTVFIDTGVSAKGKVPDIYEDVTLNTHLEGLNANGEVQHKDNESHGESSSNTTSTFTPNPVSITGVPSPSTQLIPTTVSGTQLTDYKTIPTTTGGNSVVTGTLPSIFKH
jgi:hypothetical protein